MSYLHDSDSDEYDDIEVQRLEKWDKIKHFTVRDYLSCNETRSILKQHWNDSYNDTEGELYELFDKYKSYFDEKHYDILSFADNVHSNDFVSLITHHIKKKFDISIFEDDPSLANPLVAQIDEIKKERMRLQKEKMFKQYKESVKTFDWGTKKYV